MDAHLITLSCIDSADSRLLLQDHAADFPSEYSFRSFPKLHGRVALLPFARIVLKALKPKETDFEPQTLGEHLLRRRLERGLTQAEVASQLGMSPLTVLNLEKNRTEPPMRAYPALIRWLGYDPFPVPKTLQERMRAARRAKGWTVGEAAKGLGVDPATWGEWERRGRVAWERYRERLEVLLARVL